MRTIKVDHGQAELDDATRQLLDFAAKLAADPAALNKDDVAELRKRGFKDKDITDAVHNVAFFAYINRVALGLGVDMEPFMLRGGENVGPHDEV